ncbi:hypothetical protein RU07_02045 [Agrobacterium tumefaciens]|uniref:Uncharacterized protein n=1 Tax=Agrobacterium tumefaciens TaxID=358 RepID=A0A0D0L5H9_AGRTU|nr:hypothetical protein RU07_02045 [Agrobacterium tumefaciens]
MTRGVAGLVTPGGGAPAKDVVVTTRGETASNTIGVARTSANVKQRFRKQVFAGQGGIKAGTLKLVLGAYGVPDSGVETVTDGYTAESHFEVGGVAYPFNWGGAASGAIPSGSASVESGVATGHPDVAAGTTCYLVIAREYAVGALPVFDSAPGTGTTGDSAHFAVAGTNAGIGVPGVKTATGGWTAQSSVFDLPFVLVGQQLNAATAIYCIGASVERGQQDSSGDGTAGGGYIRRGLNPSGGTKHAFLIGAKRGESLSTFLASGSKRLTYLKYANSILLGFGGNDFTNGVPVNTALASLSTVNDLIIAAGVERRALLGMVVKTDTTDAYATIANQTPRSGFAAFRTAFHAGAASLGMTVVDTSSSWEDASNLGYWKVNGTANWSTSDGTHPTTVRHQEAGVALQSQLGSFLTW